MLNNKSWSNRFETLSVGFSAKQKITGRGSLALKHKKRSSRLDELARTYRYERIASGALANGQLEYLSCVWQDLSSSRPLRAPFSLALFLLYRSPLRLVPFCFTDCLILATRDTLLLYSIGLATPLDTQRVWVRMFGYAKCSCASQVECLMALFCLNTDPDTTGGRTMSSDLHTYGDDVHQTHHHLSNNPFVCSN